MAALAPLAGPILWTTSFTHDQRMVDRVLDVCLWQTNAHQHTGHSALKSDRSPGGLHPWIIVSRPARVPMRPRRGSCGTRRREVVVEETSPPRLPPPQARAPRNPRRHSRGDRLRLTTLPACAGAPGGSGDPRPGRPRPARDPRPPAPPGPPSPISPNWPVVELRQPSPAHCCEVLGGLRPLPRPYCAISRSARS